VHNLVVQSNTDDFVEDNLDLFHHIFALSLEGRLYLAPISKEPHRVLDIGITPHPFPITFQYLNKKQVQVQEYGQ
jgi:hypothetical protein